MKSIKYILPVSFFLLLLSCTSEPSDHPNDQLKNDAKFDYFSSNELNVIVDEYIRFIKSQEDTNIHNQYVMLHFYEKNNQFKFYLSTDRHIAVYGDNPYAYHYLIEFEGTKIFISDHETKPLGYKYYRSDKLMALDDVSKYQPIDPYSIIIFDEMTWYYRVKDDQFICTGKVIH